MTMILSLLLTSILSSPLPPADGIAALVGDQPILVSDVAEALRYQLQANPALKGLSSTERAHRVLDQMVDDKILLIRAKAETLDVPESEVSARVEQRIAEMTERAGGADALIHMLKAKGGLNLGQYRLRLARQIKEDRLKEKLRDKYVGKVDPVREEVLSFYRVYKDSMPMLPDQVKLAQIVVKVTADPARDSAALHKAKDAIEQLRQGADFATLAKDLSDDPGSKEKGGDIGFTKRGELDPAYEKAAVALEIGRYTQIPVRSRYGWHVIELTDRRDQEFRTRHILVSVIPNALDTARAKELADSLRRVADAGGDFAAMARKYSAEKASASFGGTLGWYPENELQGQFKDLISGIPTGKTGEPVPTADGLLVIRVEERLQSRKLTPDEDWSRLSQLAGQMLSNQKLSVWLGHWREQVPVDIRIAPEELARRIGS
jgi:peptidyl-prolyl cis-trans isomerase SurA